MTITLSWQSIITAGAVITALTVIIALFVKIVRFIDHQKAQDVQISANREERERELEEIRKMHEADMKATRSELTLMVYGVLACLKGLKEQGCNGPVSEAIKRIEKHLNIEAHK